MNTPGQEIRRMMTEKSWSQADLAFVMGKDPTVVSRLVTGKQHITPSMSLLLAAALGTPKGFWLDLEIENRLADHVPDPKKMAAIRERVKQHERGEKIERRCSKCGQTLMGKPEHLGSGPIVNDNND